MTEERMIVTNDLLTESANNAGDFKAFLLIVRSKAESVPPKDWVGPLCKQTCGGTGITYQGRLCEECKGCPVRKLEG